MSVDTLRIITILALTNFVAQTVAPKYHRKSNSLALRGSLLGVNHSCTVCWGQRPVEFVNPRPGTITQDEAKPIDQRSRIDELIDVEDGIGLGGILARATTSGTVGILCGEKTDSSCRVSVKPQFGDPGMDDSVVEERTAISNRNFTRKLSQKRCVTGVMTGTEDDVLALPGANEEVETLCPLFVR